MRRFARTLACLPVAIFLVAAMATTIPAQAQDADPEQLKHEAFEQVASMQKLSQVMVDSIFSFAELGFQEHQTAAYITGLLRDEGFEIEMGCAGMPTCYVATWGSGHPVIGFMGDIDGLPETSQRPGIPYQDPLIPNGPGHGEGHNSAAAVDIIGAIATKRVMEEHGLQGTLVVIPGVAEELVASRTFMVNDGLFEGMDAMLSTHISTSLGTQWGISGSGLVSTQFTFHGKSAHGAGSPWAGRSALDAVELMNIGWNFRREHLRLQQRSHYMIPNGGNQPNVVPSEASVWYYFRELDYQRIKDLHELGQTMAAAAAMMTGTTVTERVFGAAWPSHMNKVLAEVMHANVLEVGMPQWTDDDQAFARAVQDMMGTRGEMGFGGRETDGLPTEFFSEELREADQGMGGGSDDIAEVSWNVPTVRLGYPGQIPGITFHHWSAGIAMATPIAHQGANYGARVIAMTAIDLVANPEKVEEAWQYHREVTTADQQWESLIPLDTEPAIFLNEEKMARFRPLLEELRYDPERFDTYLEQLGITYPTLGREEGEGSE
jgi:aminobenzoyl-glutamate utilization protein B